MVQCLHDQGGRATPGLLHVAFDLKSCQERLIGETADEVPCSQKPTFTDSRGGLLRFSKHPCSTAVYLAARGLRSKITRADAATVVQTGVWG